jgi:ureidoglycolate hydrolase
MDTSVLEIKEYTGEGYRPLIDFVTWRVAILRWIETSPADKITYMERHMQTDEVFVLLAGRAALVMGGSGAGAEGLQVQTMESGKLYNVRQAAWHTVLLSRDASILIVENQDTGESNTEYFYLTVEQKQEIMQMGEYS